VLDLRAYRAAFVPAIAVLLLAAFSLADRPEPVRATLAADVFDGDRAFEELTDLARRYPDRRAGGPGDQGLADHVRREFGRAGFAVSSQTDLVETAEGEVDVETVIGERQGRGNRSIVVLAHRDAIGRGAAAELSATAAQLEIARRMQSVDLTRTVRLVSTSGGSAGSGGARAWARRAARAGDIDAVLVLGDLASNAVHKPFVVPWTNAGRPAPIALRRTVEAATRDEVGVDPGASRAAAQWARRAVPLTLSEQGEVLAAGIPAVRLSVTGERTPPPDARVTDKRLVEFGRAALNATTALESAPGREPFASSGDGLVTLKRVLPAWVVRLLVLALLLPALVTAFDAFFRVRRRGLPAFRWLAWTALCGAPVLVGWAWLRALGALDAITAPRGPAPAGAVELGAGGIAVAVSALLVAVGAAFGAHRLGLRALGLAARPRGTGGTAAAAGILLAATALAVWCVNPWAAALLVPAAHLWLLASAPETRWRAPVVALAVSVGLVLPALVLLHYAHAFAMGPADLARLVLLAAAAGEIGVLDALALSLVFGALVATVSAVRARGRTVAAGVDPIRTRGPVGYAGPGSLGGTESAL
jgi:hypothetical protein